MHDRHLEGSCSDSSSPASSCSSRQRSEEHTSELQSQSNLVCRLLLEKKNNASPYPLDASTTTSAWTCRLRRLTPSFLSRPMQSVLSSSRSLPLFGIERTRELEYSASA